MKLLLPISAAAVLALGATTANAQDVTTGPANWTGFYVGGQLGYGWQPKDTDETLTFDTNQDGKFDNTVVTGTGANAFAPGFCGSRYIDRTRAAGCRKDNDAAGWKIHAGYDMQFGDTPEGFVVGGIIEGGKDYLFDYVTGFSSTPHAYRIGARLKENGAIRGRAGYSLSTGTLFYGTGGVAYGKIENSYATTNPAAFTTSDTTKNSWGYNYGGGVEQKVGPFSVGALYLFTALKNHDFTVRQTGGPFSITNATGTDIKRGFGKFAYHQVRATVSYRF